MANEGGVHVVDDDEALRESLALLLDCSGLEVRTYDSALAFLERLGEMERGCIVTDIRMPGMSGLELVQRLNAEGIGDPVIVITGHGDVPLAVEAMKAGASDFIEMPFGDDHLLGAIRTALARGSGLRREEEERKRIAGRIEALSARERQVLD